MRARAVGVAQRDQEDVLRLAGREAALGDLGPPAQLGQLGDDPGADVAALGRGDLAEAVHGVVGDALLDLRRHSSGG